MVSMDIRFVKNKVTKNTIRYGEVKGEGRSEVSGSLYILKGTLIGKDVDEPEELKVTVEW